MPRIHFANQYRLVPLADDPPPSATCVRAGSWLCVRTTMSWAPSQLLPSPTQLSDLPGPSPGTLTTHGGPIVPGSLAASKAVSS